ncbi:MAG: hypothetical protein QF903_01020 [Planctomycetota bacterium]|jgi:hypothetical protein|nr:hypothetical protein [Planctomycetota bacterium]MDP6763276.1 hypothetical protein [Planctomycetota bacterium]MDP6988042.1 hypothetical protein [Planctomycetota bacterium]
MHTKTLALTAALALPALLASRLLPAQESDALILGTGNHRFEWVRDWAQLPEGVGFGNTNGCIVSDSAGRVSLFDGEGELLARLGDNPDPSLQSKNDVPRERWADGEFLSPHCVHFDARGDAYVMDWNAVGRITKLRRLSR